MKKRDKMEFKITKQQRQIIEAPEDFVCVMASAGTSKTFCLIERIKWLVSQNVDPQKIIAITYTRNAAQEILQRLDPIQIGYCGTIHAYANYLLLCNGIETQPLAEKDQFDEFFELIKENPVCVEDLKIEHLLLDEAQDSGYNQFEFIFDVLKPTKWTVFGDIKQSIYEFNGGEPKLLENLSKYSWVTTYQMAENFRNGRQIHEYANFLLSLADRGYQDNSKLMRGVTGKRISFEYDLDLLIDYINSYDEYRDWFVLCRDNKQKDAVIAYLKLKKIPCDTFKQGELTNEEIKQTMEQNTVKVLTIHSSKGLQRKNVAVIGARLPGANKRYLDNKAVEEVRIAYVAATRAENLLLWLKAGRPVKKKTSNWE
jgi:superfamily I DNA/RNA helicase